MIKIQIIIGSTRDARYADKVTNWVYDHAKKDKRMEVEIVDLKDYPLPFYNDPIPPKGIKGNYNNPTAKKWVKKVSEADAYIFISPEYNHGYSAVLKNALDYPYYEWNNKPAAFVSYGATANGARAVEQLRQVVIELQMAPIQAGVHIALMQRPFDEQGKMTLPHYEYYMKSLNTLFDQIVWWGEALLAARKKTLGKKI